MKKIKLLAVLLLSTIGLASCDMSRFDFSKENSTNTQERDSIYKIATSNQVVEVHVENNETVPTTIEQAVDKVFDSVVVINAYLSNGVSAGSGVIFGESENASYVITCHHVIEGAKTFEVTTSDASVYQAALIGGDATTDIAVLAISKTGLSVASFINDSENVNLGSQAIVIGNPLGTLANSVTSGIISAKERDIRTSDGTLHKLMQTDAAINSGNSGGGLFNIAGELIGIVSAKYSATGVEGLGFAIPANTAKSISEELCQHGYIEGRYKLGISITDGQYVSGGFFGTRYNVTYISSIDSDGSCYGLLNKDDILSSIKVIYKDSSKESISLSSVSSSSSATTFLENANLSLGDKVIFGVKRNGYNSNITEVEVEIEQYIYTI